MATTTDKPIITVKRDWTRPAPDVVAKFAAAPTGNVSDAVGRAGSVDPDIKPRTSKFRFAGTAVPIDAGKHDNLAFWAALDSVREGDVMMVSTHDHVDCAVVGDLIISFARNRGAVAVVTDGMIRDAEALEEVGLPVFSRGIRPSGPQKAGPGAVGLPVWIGGQRVCAGDIIVGDMDGVVVVAQSLIESALPILDEIVAKEAGMEEDGKNGLPSPRNIDSFLAGVEIVHVE